jgi:proline iminopeptidase
VRVAAGITGLDLTPPAPETYRLPWEADGLYFAVREPFTSRTSQATIVFSRLNARQPLVPRSHMPENGVIFSHGIESDYVAFNSGAVVTGHAPHICGCAEPGLGLPCDPASTPGPSQGARWRRMAMDRRASMRVKTSGATLSVHHHAGEGVPIVLLHGGPGFGDYLGPAAELLSPPHWVIGYDQRGTGQSSRAGPYHFRDHVEDLNDLRRHLAVDRLHLFGHSWGGLLAPFYAKAYPQHVASLVLCCSIANTGPAFAALEQQALADRVIKRLRTPATVWWYLVSQVPGLADTGYQNLIRLAVPYYYARPEQAPPFAGADRISKRGGDLTMVSVNATDSSFLRQLPLEAPVIVLQGRHDVFLETHALLLERFPHARSVWVEDAGHFVWHEQPDIFRQTLLSFYGQSSTTPPAA